MQSIQDLEKFLNSELNTKIKSSKINHNQIYLKIDEENLITGGYWSVYYYRGKIYATEIVRGLDVFQLTESEFISQKQIDMAAKAFPAYGPQNVFNPQQQVPMQWAD